VLCDSPFDVFTNSTLFILGEQPPTDVLGNLSVFSGFLIGISNKDFWSLLYSSLGYALTSSVIHFLKEIDECV